MEQAQSMDKKVTNMDVRLNDIGAQKADMKDELLRVKQEAVDETTRVSNTMPTSAAPSAMIICHVRGVAPFGAPETAKLIRNDCAEQQRAISAATLNTTAGVCDPQAPAPWTWRGVGVEKHRYDCVFSSTKNEYESVGGHSSTRRP